MFIQDEVFTVDCSGVRGINTQGHVFPHRFQAFRHRLRFLCFLDFKCSYFTSTLFILDQAFRLRRCLRFVHIKHSECAFIWIRCSNFICITIVSTTVETFRLRLLQIRRSDFTFIWIRCSDFISINIASTAVKMFRLRLLQIRCSNFAFLWIKCSDFICIIVVSTAVETFKLRPLQIRR